MENKEEKVRIVSTTNKREDIKAQVGEVRLYSRYDGCALLVSPGTYDWTIRTSLIESETREGNIITIKTQNSIYVLESLEGNE